VWESDEQATIENHFKARVVPGKSTYATLQQQGATSAAASSGSNSDGMMVDGTASSATAAAATAGNGFGAVQMAIAAKPDESWMDDNPSEGGNGEQKQKKKKKDKKSKY
jgi:hypothetical protein